MNIEHKNFEIDELKTKSTEDGFYFSGIANNKRKTDSYGDYPDNYEGKNVYDLSRFKKNPVLLADHQNSVGNIIGTFTKIKETDKGLEFEAKLMPNPQTDIAKHAVEAIKGGFARALSIGGMWKYENPKNPNQLTSAYLHEISAVAIGADEYALTDIPKPKHLSQDDILKQIEEKSSKSNSEELEPLIEAFRKQYELDANNKNNTGE